MRLIVGLGNPGPEYEDTRHNVGFMLVDAVARAFNIRFERLGRRALWGSGVIASEEVILVKPLTFMNLSGVVVREFCERYNVPVGSVIVAFDDCDLPPGRIRLRKSGGSGGHRGVSSIMECIESAEFARIRLGIGRPERGELSDYVLQRLAPDEKEALEDMLQRGVASVETFLKEGMESAMNKFNR